MKTLEQYKGILATWNNKAGRRPTVKELEQAHRTGHCRPGAKNTVAIAMALREMGVTQSQIKLVLGHTHYNKMKSLVRQKVARMKKTTNDHGLTVYKLLLTQ